MREILARIVCAATIALLLALGWIFAERHNPLTRETSAAPNSLPKLDAEAERGRAVYTEQGCSSCHSIAGRGNPRHVLDGVGARREPGELREWATGTGNATRELSSAVLRQKAKYRELPENDLKALTHYLASLRGKRDGPS